MVREVFVIETDSVVPRCRALVNSYVAAMSVSSKQHPVVPQLG